MKKLLLLLLMAVAMAPLQAQDNTVYETAEHMPEFPGGDAALMQYLSQNIVYPVDAEEAGIEGRVVVSFVVEKNGTISSPTVVKSVAPSLDQEAVRVVSGMPRWKQGLMGIHPVRVKYTIPITFRLTDGGKTTASSAATAGSSKSATKAVATGPATGSSKPAAGQRQHMKFLGLELGGNAKAFEKALRAKGFKDGNGFDNSGNTIFLSGTVYGQMAEVTVDATGGRANGVNVVSMVANEAKAKQRFNTLKQKMTAEYGQGYTPWDDNYEIALTYGSVSCGYGPFDSGDYEVGLHVTDYEAVLDKPDYNVNVYGLAAQFFDGYTKWNNARQVLADSKYTVKSASATQIKANRHFLQFNSDVTINRPNAQTTKVGDVLISTTNSMTSVMDQLRFADFTLVDETQRGGKLYKNSDLKLEIYREGGLIFLHLTK